MKWGYVQSKGKFDRDLQINAIKEKGVDRFIGKSIIQKDFMKNIKADDQIIVFHLAAFGLPINRLIQLLIELNQKKIGVNSIYDELDTTGKEGKLIIKTLKSLQRAGIDYFLMRTLPCRIQAKKQQKKGGRPKKLNPTKVVLAEKLYNNPQHTVEDICNILEISKPTLYAYLHKKHNKL